MKSINKVIAVLALTLAFASATSVFAEETKPGCDQVSQNTTAAQTAAPVAGSTGQPDPSASSKTAK